MKGLQNCSGFSVLTIVLEKNQERLLALFGELALNSLLASAQQSQVVW